MITARVELNLKPSIADLDLCFVDPFRGGSHSYVIASENLGISYIAAVLEQHGYTTDLVDCDTHDLSPEAAVDLCLAKNPKMLGFTMHTWRSIEPAFKMVELLRRRSFKGPIIFGGRYPTIRYAEILTVVKSAADFVCIGEGELTMLELTGALLRQEGELTHIAGLARWRGSGVEVAARRQLVADLDTLPYPKRFNAAEVVKRGAPFSVLATRGCWYGKCTFCSVSRMEMASGLPPARRRRSEEIVKEMLLLMDEFGVDDFMLVGDSFIRPGARGREELQRFMDALAETGRRLTFGFACQPRDLDQPTFARLKELGLTSVFLGVESGSAKELQFYRKPSNLGDNRKAAQIVRELNLSAPEGMGLGGFIFYSPESNLADIKANLDFLETYGSECDWNFFTHCRVLDGTPLEDLMAAAGRLTPFDWKGYHIRDPQVQLLDSLIHPVRKMVTRGLDQVIIYQFRYFRACWRRGAPGNPYSTLRDAATSNLLSVGSQVRALVVQLYRRIIAAIEDGDLSPVANQLSHFRENYVAVLDRYAQDSLALAQNHRVPLPSRQNDLFPPPPPDWQIYFEARRQPQGAWPEPGVQPFGYGEV